MNLGVNQIFLFLFKCFETRSYYIAMADSM